MPRTGAPKMSNEEDRKPVIVLDLKEASLKDALAWLTKAINRVGLPEDKEGYAGVTCEGTIRVFGA